MNDDKMLSRESDLTKSTQVHRVLDHAALPKWVGWGRFPTPLDARPDISQALGVEVLLKREDTLDDLGCGHKVRKLGYVVADALQRQATVLITSGSLPSSQCVAVAVAAKRHGLRAHLVYSGDRQVKPIYPQGNYLLATLLDPSITWHESAPWTEIESHIEAIARLEEKTGERPYVVPPGISAWPGLLGSIDLGLELAEQLDGDFSEATYIVAPAGSGGTCLGLSIAAKLLGLRWYVIGVCIGGTKAGIERQTTALLEQAIQAVGHPYIREAKVIYDDGALGDGYDEPRSVELDAMRDVLSRYNLLFDPNYMIKTFLGLREMVDRGTISGGARVVLVHTGGSLGIFGDSPSLRRWYLEQLGAHLAR